MQTTALVKGWRSLIIWSNYLSDRGLLLWSEKNWALKLALLNDGGEVTKRLEKSLSKNPTRNPRRPSNFTEKHKAHVLNLVDNNLQATVWDVLESLTKSFGNFSLTKSVIHKHMNEICNLPIKKPHFKSEKRNSSENLQERFVWFMKWKDSDADFTKNCIFINDSGFHIKMWKNYAWSKKSERAVVKLPQTQYLVLYPRKVSFILHWGNLPHHPRKIREGIRKAVKARRGVVTVVEGQTDITEYSQKPPKGKRLCPLYEVH